MQLIKPTFLQKKFTKKKSFKKASFQSRSCHLIGDMLKNGFSLVEVLQFFQKLTKEEALFGDYLLEGIAKGQTIPESFAEIGFPKSLVLQLEMAEVHGNLAATFEKMGQFVDLKIQQKEALKKALFYPSVLLGFILGFILLLRYAIVPQLSQVGNFEEATLLNFLLKLPTYLGLFLIGGVFTFFIAHHFLKKVDPLKKSTWFSRLPVTGELYRFYVTAILSGELGKLFSLGIDLKEVYLLLTQQQSSLLLQEIGNRGLLAGQNGEELKEVMGTFSFLQPEFTLMIQTGELRGKLAEELLYYSQILWREFVLKVQKKVQYLQPIAFIIVAVLIVLLYGSLLLPIYDQTWEVLE